MIPLFRGSWKRIVIVSYFSIKNFSAPNNVDKIRKIILKPVTGLPVTRGLLPADDGVNENQVQKRTKTLENLMARGLDVWIFRAL